MSHLLSFETAKKLKESGFPQPEPKTGQFWIGYNSDRLFIVTEDMPKDSLAFVQATYCPSAQDFLEQMPGASLENCNGIFYVSAVGCIDYFYNANLLESCARTWLHLNKKPEAAKFPEFWYESQGTWGGVPSLARLVEFARYQIYNSDTFNIDEFLDKSRRAPLSYAEEANGLISFGTRREHKGEQTLRMYLDEHGILTGFLDLWKEEKP